jgi:hypothetical protein
MDIEQLRSLFVNLLVHSQQLIDNLEDLKETRLYNQSLKNKGNSLLTDLEKCVKRTFDKECSMELLRLYDAELDIYKRIGELTLPQRAILSAFLEDLKQDKVKIIDQDNEVFSTR